MSLGDGFVLVKYFYAQFSAPIRSKFSFSLSNLACHGAKSGILFSSSLLPFSLGAFFDFSLAFSYYDNVMHEFLYENILNINDKHFEHN